MSLVYLLNTELYVVLVVRKYVHYLHYQSTGLSLGSWHVIPVAPICQSKQERNKHTAYSLNRNIFQTEYQSF
jgi:hypothetical protein